MAFIKRIITTILQDNAVKECLKLKYKRAAFKTEKIAEHLDTLKDFTFVEKFYL